MPNRAIVYVSEAVPGFTSERLKTLMEDAARFNRSAGVTGVLLFDGRHFLQYMEGRELPRWKNSSRSSSPMLKRPDWSMRLL
ncbi:MAG: BLUF domain-containing protein [Stenotrophomonas sp.]|nr:BLUF domain-containing protein [Stenotrophomonas sp.]